MIVCKGVKQNGSLEPCRFIYDGNWGDVELVKHQKFHENNQNTSYWLGFDIIQPFGKYSGRDGK